MALERCFKKPPNSSRQLDEIAKRLLRAAEVGDQLPTPQDDVIACAELIRGGSIDLDDFKETFFDKVGKAFYSGWQKLKAILDVRERTIYISADIHPSQMVFATFHEVAHNVVPWQRDAYVYYGDNEYTLSRAVERVFEQEANYLSSRIIFQCDRFAKEASDFELSLDTGIKLAQDYGASYHSTLVHYTGTHSSTCLLLILKKADHYEIANGGSEQPYLLQYAVPSRSFLKVFGSVRIQKQFDCEHPFTAVVYDSSGVEICEGEYGLVNADGEEIALNFQAWSNSYNIFVLLRKKSRTLLPNRKIVIAPDLSCL